MDAKEETFLELRQLISYTVHKFNQTHSLRYDDAHSTANLAFIMAYNNYDPNKGTVFSSWVVTKVIKGLLEDVRQMVRNRSFKFNTILEDELLLEVAVQSNYGQSLIDLLDTLEAEDPDADYVANLALDPPQEIVNFLNRYGAFTGSNYRIAIRWYLQEKGWSKERIKEAFQNIKDKL